MTIASELTDLQNNLSAAKSAVRVMGGTTGDTGLAGLASEIMNIPSGGGGGGSYNPTIPPEQPSGVNNAYIGFLPPAFKCTDVYLADSNTCVASFRDPVTFNGQWDITQVVNGHDFILEAIAQQEPMMGNPYQLAFRYNFGFDIFELYYHDVNNNTVSIAQLGQWDLEPWGIILSTTSFAQDTDIAYFNYTPYATTSEGQMQITQSEVNELIANQEDYAGDYQPGVGEGFKNFMRDSNGLLIQKKFITYVNFGEQSNPLTIENNFMSQNPYFRAMWNADIDQVGDNFLSSCTSFNQPLDLGSCAYIGVSFMENCTNFNQPLSLPQTLTHIGYQFMFGCTNMISQIDVGDLPVSIISSDIYTFSTYNSTDPAYSRGMTLAGNTASDWKAQFPNSNSSPYRRLIVSS